jgi:Ca2+-binding RTX toxin-like protein
MTTTSAGDAGNDRFNQESAPNGGDAISGSSGVDLVDYSTRRSRVVVTINNVANDGADEGDNVRTDFENVNGGSASDQITGSAAANGIAGNSGNDTLNGMNGNDRLLGGPGADTIMGGGGGDTVSGDDGNDRVLVRGKEKDTAAGGTGSDCHQSDRLDRLSGFERAC